MVSERLSVIFSCFIEARTISELLIRVRTELRFLQRLVVDESKVND